MAKKIELVCAVCESREVRITKMTQQFAYACNRRDVLLTADIPVEHCLSCGEMLVGRDGEIARHEAVCRYLGRLTPADIKSIRKRNSMTQDQFAKALSVGEASVKRWETGASLQNRATDQVIRSKWLGASKTDGIFTPVFRTKIKEYMIMDSERFLLRPGN